ncbi:MAG: hypothetical protein JST61_16295 [Acidobacteria bacterium]|nr:hypothetical protein [Acidobacteriota bacterium]
MTINLASRLGLFSCVACLSQALCQAPLPATDMHLVANIVEKDFGSVDNIRTIGMTDNPLGRFDLVVVGSKPRNAGWRAEVISVSDHKATTTWDSAVSADSLEFSNSGPKSVVINVKDYDYDLMIEGCAPHLCYDGISGFLIFSGKSKKTVKAKVVTKGLDQTFSRNPKYDVTFSPNIDDISRTALENAICHARTLSNKPGLPFRCHVT